MRTGTWGWLARFGILVTHKDPVPEAEFWAMAPAGLSIHTARFESPRRPGSDYRGDPARLMADSPDVARGLDFLGQMELDAICVCFGSSSFFGGVGFDRGFVEEASKKAHGTTVATAAQSMTTAMQATGIQRPFVVLPPWFTAAVGEAIEGYLAAAGFEIAGLHHFDLGVGWRDMRPFETWDRGSQWRVQPEDVYQQARRAFPDGSDGILVPGSGFRSLEAIELLERDLGVPVVTSNQACLWYLLQLARINAPVDHAGRLFACALPPPRPD